MGKIISVANQKGGVGKTTTTVNLAAWLGAMGQKVLLVDIDPQGNATSGFGINKRSLVQSSYDLLIGTVQAEEVILSTSFPGVDVLPSNIALAGAEIEIVELEDRAMRLKKATMYDGRLNLTMQVVAEVKKFFPQKVYQTTIPRNVRLSEAPSYGQPVLYFDRNSKGSAAYGKLAEEFLEKNRGFVRRKAE